MTARSIQYYPWSVSAVEDRTVLQPAGSVRPGTRLNGLYEIEKLIARGGMGEVYRGFNIQTMDLVAIKMIRIEFSNNKEIFELFRREASILHNLTHEAIVRYFVFSIDPDLHRAYLAMEFVEGPSLTDRLQTGPLQFGDVQILRRRVASALQVAHQHGVIHRDVSPDNIILPQNDLGNAKVIDFGIARSLYRAEVSIIGGRFAGKYNFASPEQFGLAGGEVGPWSDIYSFGLVLAAAFRGRPIDMSGTEVEAIAKRSVAPDLTDIDPTMRPLLHAMLQPAPANRPASMAEIAAWEPAASRGLWTPSARSREPRQLAARRTSEAGGGRAATVLGAGIALAALGGTAFVLRNDLARWAPSVTESGPTAGSERPQTAALVPPLKPTELTPVQGGTNAVPPLSSPPDQKPGSTDVANPGSKPGLGAGSTMPADLALPAPPSSGVGAPPTANDIIAVLPPRPPPNLDLPEAMVGARYHAELPAFSDVEGKGLRLSADGLPEGIDFSDLGDGRGAIGGVPARPGSVSIRVVAANHNGQTAQMTATLVVASGPQSGPSKRADAASPPPPRPPESTPSVRPGANSAPQAGSPSGDVQAIQIPTRPPPALEPSVSVEPSSKPPPPPSPTEKARQFVAAFNGGECFLIKRLGESSGKESYLGFGLDQSPFERFDTDYKNQVGGEAEIRGGLIKPDQCVALDLIRLGGGEPAAGPRLELENGDIGRGKPLTGKINNIAGKRLYLISVDSHGLVHRLEVKRLPGADGATFDIALAADPAPAGLYQILLAVISDTPIAVLENLHQAPLESIANRLFDEARRASASVEADYFKFVD
jgi:serine/threonine-protein kinase